MDNNNSFDDMMELLIQEKIKQLEDYKEPVQAYQLTPMQVDFAEQVLNKNKSEQHMGFLLLPIRQEAQTLYKTAFQEEQALTFAEEEESTLLDFYTNLDSIRSKVRQEEFECFLTLEQLRRHPLSKYFMALPDPLYLQLYDYKDTIHKPLDMRTIANKLLRKKYGNAQEFQTDMVTMIHNFRVYFVGNEQMFDISIKFQLLFRDIFKNEAYFSNEAIETYRNSKQRCKIIKSRPKLEPLSEVRKRKIIQQFNNLDQHLRKQIYFEISSEKFAYGKQSINLYQKNDHFIYDLEFRINAISTKKDTVKQGRTRVRKVKQEIGEQPGELNQIYYSDEQSPQSLREALQNVQFCSSEDDQ